MVGCPVSFRLLIKVLISNFVCEIIAEVRVEKGALKWLRFSYR